jgi:anti-anti-sigma factor
VDIADSDRLAAAITRAATPGAALIVDLSTIEFMDSAGLQGVLRANRDTKAHGTPLVLVPSRAVTRLFDLSGADRTLTLSPDLPHALTTAQAAESRP